MHHFRSEICSLPFPKLQPCLENHARNPNLNQYYKLITFARAGCGRKSTTKEIIISHFLLRIFIFKCRNIPAPSAYGVYISQFMLYPRACGSCHVFRDRCLLLTRKILNRRFLVVKQTSSLRKLCGRDHDLVNQIYVSPSFQKEQYYKRHYWSRNCSFSRITRDITGFFFFAFLLR